MYIIMMYNTGMHSRNNYILPKMASCHHRYYVCMISPTDILLQVDDILPIECEHPEHIKPLLCVLGYVVVPHHLEEVCSQYAKVIKLPPCRGRAHVMVIRKQGNTQ